MRSAGTPATRVLSADDVATLLDLDDLFPVTKLASVHPRNPERGLPTVNAGIALVEADTGIPASYMAGAGITNARTACVGGLAARELDAAAAEHVNGEARERGVGTTVTLDG